MQAKRCWWILLVNLIINTQYVQPEQYPPFFEETPRLNDIAEEGNVIRLRCKVKGNPPPTISWIKDNGPLQLSPRVRNLNNNRTIKIKGAILYDRGNYTCIAANAIGKINATLELNVRQGMPLPPATTQVPSTLVQGTVSFQVSVSPVTQTVSEGQATIISCKATGVPKPKITWKFKDRDLPSGINVSTTDEGSILQTQNTTKGMEGSFKCTATNKADSADSTATVRVLGIPTAEVGPNPPPTLVEGDTLRLTCKVSESESEIKWKKNGDLVTPEAHGSKEGDKKDTLVITNVDTDDSGYYSCAAHNQAGFSSSSAVEIRVRGKMFEWYYIVGPLSAVIIITFVSWYICKRRMTGITSDQMGGLECEMAVYSYSWILFVKNNYMVTFLSDPNVYKPHGFLLGFLATFICFCVTVLFYRYLYFVVKENK